MVVDSERIFGGQMSILKDYIEDFSTSSLIVVAAGNSGKNMDKDGKFTYLPSNFDSKNLIAVGGLKKTGIIIHKNSNYGPKSVDVAVPYFQPVWDLEVPGTSMGAPYISALLTKIIAENSSLSPAQIKQKFLNSANQSDMLNNYILDKRYVKKP